MTEKDQVALERANGGERLTDLERKFCETVVNRMARSAQTIQDNPLLFASFALGICEAVFGDRVVKSHGEDETDEDATIPTKRSAGRPR
jgi:hypothetical protein